MDPGAGILEHLSSELPPNAFSDVDVFIGSCACSVRCLDVIFLGGWRKRYIASRVYVGVADGGTKVCFSLHVALSTYCIT